MTNRRRLNVLGVGIDNITQADVLGKIEEYIASGRPHIISFTNPEIVMLANQYPEYMTYLNGADIVAADGIGLIWASKIYKKPLSERVAGTDFMYALAELSSRKGFTLYFLGADKGIADGAAQNLKTLYPGLNIIGTHHGYFNGHEAKRIIEDIKQKKPDILIVCLGMLKQEKWIKDNIKEINVPVCFGNGGAFDFVSGSAKRAPLYLQRAGLEWLFRLLREPHRIKRQIALFHFAVKVFRDRLRM